MQLIGHGWSELGVNGFSVKSPEQFWLLQFAGWLGISLISPANLWASACAAQHFAVLFRDCAELAVSVISASWAARAVVIVVSVMVMGGRGRLENRVVGFGVGRVSRRLLPSPLRRDWEASNMIRTLIVRTMSRWRSM